MRLRSLFCGLVATLLLAPALPAGSAEVLLVPGATRDAVTAAPSLDLLTWELPEGLLVVDRRPQTAAALDGEVFTPRHADGVWFLVYRPHLARGRDQQQPTDPAAFGHVHHTGARAWVVEVPAAGLDAFFAAAFKIQYLDTAPLATSAAAAAPVDLAAATTDTVDTALKAEYVDTLDQEAYNQLIREISGNTSFWYDGASRTVSTRYYNTAGNNLAADYMAQKLAGYGYDIEMDTFIYNGHVCRNVVATKLGTVYPDQYVVIGGHYDSTSGQAQNLAPGAEDNASGTSLVMEVARVSATRDFKRSVQFVLFDAEEVGLRGSVHFVADAVGSGRQIVAAITADMVAYYQTNYGVTIEGQTAWEWLMSLMAANVAAHTEIASNKTYYSWGSDHVPFQQAGIPAFLAIDWDWDQYPYYHRTTDTWARIQATAHQGLQIARATAATLADVAVLLPTATGAPSAPVPLVRLAAYPNPFNPQTTLSFSLDLPTDGQLAVYDLAGRQVAVLARGAFASGEHTASWDGRDDGGRAVPSGVYVARLRATTGTVSTKLNLVR